MTYEVTIRRPSCVSVICTLIALACVAGIILILASHAGSIVVPFEGQHCTLVRTRNPASLSTPHTPWPIVIARLVNRVYNALLDYR